MTAREIEIHTARVLVAEARKRRGTRFAATLLQWAANARKRAAALPGTAPIQPDLFGNRQ
jgi:hypothetical protein